MEGEFLGCPISISLCGKVQLLLYNRRGHIIYVIGSTGTRMKENVQTGPPGSMAVGEGGYCQRERVLGGRLLFSPISNYRKGWRDTILYFRGDPIE